MELKFYEWVVKIKKNYQQSQIKASIKVNSELIVFYFNLGKEINESSYKKSYGSGFFNTLSRELKKEIPDAKGFSPVNLWYMESFYTLYIKIIQQVAEKSQNGIVELDNIGENKISQQVVAKLSMVPWAHHIVIINSCKKDVNKAWFYVNKTIEKNWSRATLLNFIESNLFERQGKAITNFDVLLPKKGTDLANDLTKDPYNFNFIALDNDYNEKELKDALINNIQKFLCELGTGFAYMGREYRLKVGNTEQFLDMLFYNTVAHAYVVVEVKVTDFKPEYVGQLGTYVVAVDHILKTDRDEKTIGILICKNKDSVLARYSVDSSSQPLGISSYDLSKLIPEKFKSSMPTIEEIEEELKRK